MKGLQADEGRIKRLEFYLVTLAVRKHVLRYSRQAKKTFCNCAKKIRKKAGLLDQDMIDLSWKFVTSMLNEWEKSSVEKVHSYEAW